MQTEDPDIFKQTAFTAAASPWRHEREPRESGANVDELAVNSLIFPPPSERTTELREGGGGGLRCPRLISLHCGSLIQLHHRKRVAVFLIL